MYCPQCGAENTAAAKFCTTCGAPQKVICAVERAPAAQKVVPGASPEVCEKNSVEPKKSAGGGPRFPKRKTIVLCFCAILCLITIGSAALLLRPKKQSVWLRTQVRQSYASGEVSIQNYLYDDMGNPISIELRDALGSAYMKADYNCNVSENQITMDVYDFINNEDAVAVSIKYTYDEHGKQVGEECYDGAGALVWRFENIYDKHGILIKIEQYQSEDLLTGFAEYTYDDDGKRLSFASYGDDGAVGSHGKYIYNDQGILSKIESYGIIDAATGYQDVFTGYDEYTYDSHGNISSIKSYKSDGMLWQSYEYTYEERSFSLKRGEYIESCYDEFDFFANGGFTRLRYITEFSVNNELGSAKNTDNRDEPKS